MLNLGSHKFFFLFFLFFSSLLTPTVKTIASHLGGCCINQEKSSPESLNVPQEINIQVRHLNEVSDTYIISHTHHHTNRMHGSEFPDH